MKTVVDSTPTGTRKYQNKYAILTLHWSVFCMVGEHRPEVKALQSRGAFQGHSLDQFSGRESNKIAHPKYTIEHQTRYTSLCVVYRTRNKIENCLYTVAVQSRENSSDKRPLIVVRNSKHI